MNSEGKVISCDKMVLENYSPSFLRWGYLSDYQCIELTNTIIKALHDVTDILVGNLFQKGNKSNSKHHVVSLTWNNLSKCGVGQYNEIVS